MQAPTFEDWQRWSGSFSALPAFAACPMDGLPRSWLTWWADSPCSALLETGKAGRYTILSPKIEQLLIVGESSSRRLHLGAAGEWQTVETLSGSPPAILRSMTRRFRSPSLPAGPPFTGGWIGFLSYDLARVLEKLPKRAEDDLKLPLATWALADRAYVYDHQEKLLYCVTNRPVTPGLADRELECLFSDAGDELQAMKEEWDQRAARSTAFFSPGTPGAEPLREELFSSSLSKAEFVSAVRKIQDYIRSGDTYQVNLSVRKSRPLAVAPEEVYEKLRAINPSPYMALLRFPDFALVSGSPELLVRLRQGRIEARPIAGTRPRGADAREDESMTRELVENSKERAEHLMLVDLIRNDIGRVASYGSVKVPEFMSIETYSHVLHIVSHVEGRLAEGKDLVDVIAAVFPGGTITGAPKVRTMEIIEELEPVRRGPYTGSIGWIGFNRDMQLNITIRTLLCLDGRAYVQAGAGIVIDSDPHREYEEALNKARALWAAIDGAESALTVSSPGSC